MSSATRLAAGLAASAILLTGCSAGSISPAAAPVDVAGSWSSSARDAQVGAPSAASAESGSATPADGRPLATEQRMVARSASLTLVTEDMPATADQIRVIAEGLEGWVVDESLTLADGQWYGRSYVHVSVPSSQLDKASDQVAALGTVRDRSTTAEDVTDVVVDVDARIRALEASVKRLEELVGRAGSIADIAAVEHELSSRQADLESLKSQRLSLAGRVERSTLSVSLVNPGSSTTTNPLQAGWNRGVEAMMEAIAAIITLVLALLPGALVLAAVIIPIVWLVRRRRAKGGRTVAPAASSARTRPVDDRADAPAPAPAPAED